MSGLVTAKLFELDDKLEDEKSGGKRASVQFNPETLKVTYANQIVDPPTGASNPDNGSAKGQFVGAGSTRLALQLWFDINVPMPGSEPSVDDVRRLTQSVTQLMQPEASATDKQKYIPPVVRFEWGSFKFDGVIESLEETLDFFSEKGVPLRASMALVMSQQKILIIPLGTAAGRQRKSPGAEPLAAAAQGSSVQGIAAAAGKGGNWQSIASANGIENPRQLAAGQLLNLSTGRKRY
ncbi:MAG: hypothetical protein AW08_01516 [Candidatus Accumulibacter adjunctus]|uniref:Contractile injection system tube protein N-terminal domain-containing protein n=1 Tax=Candidatus Accumulibacter adjunctus TaxID=1454001 RepID=A0A011NTK7_9PROT|nr:MAG: hypothetical protein AW08_01516 [Candidatus Accumulibacter adjunctus]